MIKLIKNNLIYFLIIIFFTLFSKILIAEEFGTKEEALVLLERAVALVKIDKNRALDLFASGDGGLHQKDLYKLKVVLLLLLHRLIELSICLRYLKQQHF